MFDFNDDFYQAKKLQIREDTIFSIGTEYWIRNEEKTVVGKIKEKQSDFFLVRFLDFLYIISMFRYFRKSCLLYSNLEDQAIFQVDSLYWAQLGWQVKDIYDQILGNVLINTTFGFKVKLKIDVQAPNETNILTIEGYFSGKDLIAKNSENQTIAQINKKSRNPIYDLFFAKKHVYMIDFETECTPCTSNERKLIVAALICLDYFYQRKH